MKINTNPEKINEVLTRSVENIYPDWGTLEKVLKSGKRIRLYNGIDPTGRLHLGHLAVLRKLRQFQDLGHEVIILIGDFTALIGDPTDKSAARKPLTREQVSANAKNYKKQIGKFLDLGKANVKFLHNERWSDKLKPTDLLALFSYFTVARLLERDMFQKRIAEGRNILLHEFVYPVFQAYDSVAMDVDLEIGGNDQTFNMLAGRDLAKKMKNKEKFVMALKLLIDPSGKKMGKTEGNLVSLAEKPAEMYGRIMAWPDQLIGVGLELLTAVPQAELRKIIRRIELKKINPRAAKARLAKEIVASCHNPKAAALAEKEFNKVFQKKQLPTIVPKIRLAEQILGILDLLVKTKMASSKSEAKRLILQKGVKIDGAVQSDWRKIISVKTGMVIRAGKRRFGQIV